MSSISPLPPTFRRWEHPDPTSRQRESRKSLWEPPGQETLEYRRRCWFCLRNPCLLYTNQSQPFSDILQNPREDYPAWDLWNVKTIRYRNSKSVKCSPLIESTQFKYISRPSIMSFLTIWSFNLCLFLPFILLYIIYQVILSIFFQRTIPWPGIFLLLPNWHTRLFNLWDIHNLKLNGIFRSMNKNNIFGVYEQKQTCKN